MVVVAFAGVVLCEAVNRAVVCFGLAEWVDWLRAEYIDWEQTVVVVVRVGADQGLFEEPMGLEG